MHVSQNVVFSPKSLLRVENWSICCLKSGKFLKSPWPSSDMMFYLLGCLQLGTIQVWFVGLNESIKENSCNLPLLALETCICLIDCVISLEVVTHIFLGDIANIDQQWAESISATKPSWSLCLQWKWNKYQSGAVILCFRNPYFQRSILEST